MLKTKTGSLLAGGMLAIAFAQLQTAFAQTTPGTETDPPTEQPAANTVNCPGSPLHGRTITVANTILNAIPDVTDCNLVTTNQLAMITELNFDTRGLTSLQANDFAGLSGLQTLSLYWVALNERHNVIAVDVTAENGDAQTYLVRVTKSGAPPVSGGPLPQPQSFQSSATSSASQPVLTGSSAGEWKSQLIFAESLLDGGVRFVFAVPAAEEFGIEETPDLLGETWSPLPEEEVKILRESNGNGSDRLTIIFPKAEGKQRFLRLTPLK